MSWLEEQLKLRKEIDEQSFENAFFDLASVIMGDASSAARINDSSAAARTAIGNILKSLSVKIVDVPEGIERLEEQLEYMLRPTGVMHRQISLEGEWWKDSIGPILGSLEDGTTVALLPTGFTGYKYWDEATGKYARVTQKLGCMLKKDAFCFYKPLPPRSIGIKDLMLFMVRSLSIWDYIFIAGITFISTLIGLITPYATQILLSNIVAAGVAENIVPIAVLIISATMSCSLIFIITQVINARVETKLRVAVDAAAMGRMLSLPASFYKSCTAGEMSQKIKSVSTLAAEIKSTVLDTGLTALFSFIYVAQIYAIAPTLALPALIILFGNLIFVTLVSLCQLKYQRSLLHSGTVLNGTVFSLFSGVQKIKLAGAEKRMFGKWARQYKEKAKLLYDPPLLIKFSPIISVIFTTGGLLLLYYTAALTNVSSGVFIAFSASYALVSSSILGLSHITQTIATIKPIMELVAPILQTEPEIEENKKTIQRLSGGIELNHISFKYEEDGPLILNDINLKIKPNQYIAIVGKTGCGKSTLVRLLLGFEKPDAGVIYYDGQDLSKLDIKSVRRNIGVVMQNSKLFAGSIYSNIVVSAPHLGLDDAWKAAKIAGVEEDIKNMPMNMHTIISEGSGGISGGQKQRLMIARAIAPRPKIIMFDEATSALDNITQKQVSDSLNALKCTRIVIAHRLSTIKQCDRIIYLDKGKIIEDGTYEELVKLNGAFTELVKRQML